MKKVLFALVLLAANRSFAVPPPHPAEITIKGVLIDPCNSEWVLRESDSGKSIAVQVAEDIPLNEYLKTSRAFNDNLGKSVQLSGWFDVDDQQLFDVTSVTPDIVEPGF